MIKLVTVFFVNIIKEDMTRLKLENDKLNEITLSHLKEIEMLKE
jgi:hypothetical protein